MVAPAVYVEPFGLTRPLEIPSPMMRPLEMTTAGFGHAGRPGGTNGLSAPYWTGLRHNRLLVQRCSHCQTWQFGPEWLCPRCHAFDPEWIEVEPRGRYPLQTTAYLPSLVSRIASTPERAICSMSEDIAPEEDR